MSAVPSGTNTFLPVTVTQRKDKSCKVKCDKGTFVDKEKFRKKCRNQSS